MKHPRVYGKMTTHAASGVEEALIVQDSGLSIKAKGG